MCKNNCCKKDNIQILSPHGDSVNYSDYSTTDIVIKLVDRFGKEDALINEIIERLYINNN